MNIIKARKGRDASSPQAEKGKKTAKKVALSFGRVLMTLLLICVISGCIITCVLVAYVMSFVDERIDPTLLDNLPLDYTSTVYAVDSDTGEYVEVEHLYSQQNRIWAEWTEIPQNLKDAFISVEDERFETHSGVDWKRTILSFVNLVIPIYDGTPGGSTITQQLIKNLTGNDDFRIDRKVREIMQALNLEKDRSKDQILLSYLNTIYLGNNAYGVQVAANTYFNKDVSELTLAECACIAAITQNPTRYNPFRHPDNLETRQHYVLRKMLELGKITEEEYNEALAQEITFDESQREQVVNNVQSYFVEQAVSDIVADLEDQYGWSETYAKNQLFVGGYQIYITMDAEIQDIVDKAYADQDTFPSFANLSEDEQPRSAMVIMDPNGKVVAIAGARGTKTANLVWNYATDSQRQPGSAIKPLTVYSPALEQNEITYSTILNDYSHSVPNGKDANGENVYWTPRNSYSGYRGNMTAAEAVARSCNTIAAQVVERLSSYDQVKNTVTPQICFDFGKDRFQLDGLVSSKTINGKSFTDVTPAAMALGALTDGVTLMDMTGAYQAFANGGRYTEPYLYTQVLDSDGKVILSNNTTAEQVLSEDTAYVMNKMLQYAVDSSFGTCTRMRIDNMTVCGKTGTTTDLRDKWAIGFTPYYVGGVWIGYDYGNLTIRGANPACITWQIVMEKIHANLQNKEFTRPDSVVEAQFCTQTGMIAADECPHKQTGWYRSSNVPEVCTTHGGSAAEPETPVTPETPATPDTPETPEDPTTSVPPAEDTSSTPEDPEISSEPETPNAEDATASTAPVVAAVFPASSLLSALSCPIRRSKR